MARGSGEVIACIACAKAKRRCGKQTPECLRCRTKGIPCKWRAKKPSCFVLCSDEAEAENTRCGHPTELKKTGSLTHTTRAVESTTTTDPYIPDVFQYPTPNLTFTFPLPLNINNIASLWFTSPEKWSVHVPAYVTPPLGTLGLRPFVAKMRSWFHRWVTTGSNPFIHAHLYRARFPRCIQDAYLVLTAWLCRGPGNEEVVYRLVGERWSELVADEGGYKNDDGSKKIILDPLEHLARVQALTEYQFIGYFDGDIGLRSRAEGCVDVLNEWMKDMNDRGASTPSEQLGQSLAIANKHSLGILSQPDTNDTLLASDNMNTSPSLLHHTWIITESIRRTFMIGSGIQIIYEYLKLHPQPQDPVLLPRCKGGTSFTTRAGVWDAPSAAAWEKLCLEVNVGLMQVKDVETLLLVERKEDIDEFAMVTLELTCGREKLEERWGPGVGVGVG